MNSRRFIAVAALAAVVVLGLGLSCDKVGIPEIFGNAQGHRHAATPIKFLATGSGNIDFVVNWGDGQTDTLVDNSAGDTLTRSHIWTEVGDYKIKAMAMLTEKNDKSSDWSPEFAITILPNDVPIAYFEAPVQAPVDVETRFTAWGVDPDGEDVSLMMRFGDEETDWSEYVPSGEPVTITHEFKDIGETLWVSARAKDINGASGPWSDSVQLVTVEAGGMLWWWFTPNEDSAAPITAPVVVYFEADDEELAYVGSEDEGYEIYGIDVSTGKRKEHGHGILPDEGYEWTTHPAYNWGNQHILIAKEDGELYAFKPSLSDAWHYPGMTKDDDLWPWEWGNMCLAGNSIYIPNLDTIIRGSDTIRDVTKFFKITDTPGRPVNPPYTLIGVQTVLGAPVVDNASNVYFVTDSGNLFKMNSNIQVQWQARVTEEKRFLYGPVIGAGGVVFCGDDLGNVHAYSPDGNEKWERALTGVSEIYLVVGKQYLFAACDNGHVYALNPADGVPAWDSAVSQNGFNVYPVLAKNGYMYVVDDNTKLFCLVQATGAKLWDIACLDYFPKVARARRTGANEDPAPSPALTKDGNIIVANDDALYCISGYKDGTLDDGAAGDPWPKWQHNNYNAGRCPVGGF
jgi:outer membrane protein assembly factor BamB